MPAYGWTMSGGGVPRNIMSSLENPKTKPAALPISPPSPSRPPACPTSSDSREASSSPPKPAPRMTTRMIGNIKQTFAERQERHDHRGATGSVSRARPAMAGQAAERLGQLRRPGRGQRADDPALGGRA